MTRKEFLETLCKILGDAKNSKGFSCFPCICAPLTYDHKEVDKVLASKVFVAVDNVILRHRMSKEVVLETQARALAKLKKQEACPSPLRVKLHTILFLREEFNCSTDQAKDAYDRHGY